jgi:hypothetical protein
MYGRAYSALRFTPGILSAEFNMLIPAECIRGNLKHRYAELPRLGPIHIAELVPGSSF